MQPILRTNYNFIQLVIKHTVDASDEAEQTYPYFYGLSVFDSAIFIASADGRLQHTENLKASKLKSLRDQLLMQPRHGERAECFGTDRRHKLFQSIARHYSEFVLRSLILIQPGLPIFYLLNIISPKRLE